MSIPGWLLPVMRTCPLCLRQCRHPRGDGCEKCRKPEQDAVR